jgi:glutamate-5-semialdehyde dehydrogenase
MAAQNIIPNASKQLVSDMVDTARKAQRRLAFSDYDMRCYALLYAAKLIRSSTRNLIEENLKDLKAAEKKGANTAYIDRLTLNESRVESMAHSLEAIANLPDPLGVKLAQWRQPNGLEITRVSTPLGIIGIIFESRPNVTVDAGGLCLMSGNAAILRSGSDSHSSATALQAILKEAMSSAGLPVGAIQVVPTIDRNVVSAMLQASGEIDVIIPRGGKSLVQLVQAEARVPVFAHLEGICHIFVSADADLKKAFEIIENAKMRRTGICGAAETLLIQKSIAQTFLPKISKRLRDAGCRLKGDEIARGIVPEVELATEEDWATEYLDSIISIKIIDGLNSAISHIAKYGSDHTDCIITEKVNEAEIFIEQVDSAIVMVNASTQFADGGEFGMGAEIGIATGRMHARGPVGAAQLTSFKYVVRGDGQTRPA